MKKSRGGDLLLITILVSLCFLDCDEHDSTKRSIGILCGLSPGFPAVTGFVDGLAEEGYVEGENVGFDIRYVTREVAEQREILKELVAEEADLILAMPTTVVQEAKRAARSAGIPVIFTVSTIEGNNLIDSIESPGKGITGVRYPTIEVTQKKYEILKRMLPDMRCLAVVYGAVKSEVAVQLAPLRALAAGDGVDLVELHSESVEELVSNIKERAHGGLPDFDAMLVLMDPIAIPIGPFIGDFCIEYGIPLVGYPFTGLVNSSLFAVDIDNYSSGRQAALLAAKVLRGVPAGDLPVSSSEIRVTIDFSRAEILGIEIPQDVLPLADIVRKQDNSIP